MSNEMKRARLIKSACELENDFSMNQFNNISELMQSIQRTLVEDTSCDLERIDFILMTLEVVTDKFLGIEEEAREGHSMECIMQYLQNGPF